MPLARPQREWRRSHQDRYHGSIEQFGAETFLASVLIPIGDVLIEGASDAFASLTDAYAALETGLRHRGHCCTEKCEEWHEVTAKGQPA